MKVVARKSQQREISASSQKWKSKSGKHWPFPFPPQVSPNALGRRATCHCQCDIRTKGKGEF